MKLLSMRAAAALALALSLAACGGGKAKFTIAGTVSGLEWGPLVLTSNGQDVTINPGTKTGTDIPPVNYAFPNQIEYGDEYKVLIKTMPPHQDCVVSSLYYNDTAGRFASINVPVACNLAAHNLSGTITGLTKDGLQLVNGTSGGNPITVAAGATSIPFGAVVYGQTYGITVLTQPTGLNCSVSNGAGTMGDADVSNITVTCVPAA